MMMMALTAGALSAGTLKEDADSMKVPEVLPHGVKKLDMPQVQGAKVSILGADYEQVIDRKGNVAEVLEDTPVRVSFELKRGDEKAVSKDYIVTVCAKEPAAQGANPKPKVIPEILQWRGGTGTRSVSPVLHIGKGVKGLDAQALLHDFAAVTGGEWKLDPQDRASGVRLRLHKMPELGDEGYRMSIGEKGVNIDANTAKGLYWGTRTLLQMLRQGPQVPCGVAVDIPRYKLRGFILDVGRLPVPYQYLKDVVDTMAWYKLNDFHIHLNDNFIFLEDYAKAQKDGFKEAYTGFRMESDVKGPDGAPLTSPDVSYTKKQFRELIDYARQRGVNIVPEFDAPAHALSFTRVRPDLRLVNNNPRSAEELDAAKPESAQFIGEVWDEYLLKNEKLGRPVFDGCVVHIGADEFKGDSEDYRKFTDAVLKHIQGRGYTPRLWGSLSIKKGNTPVRAKGVQINLWNRQWYQPEEAIAAGFDIINSMDVHLYIVPFADYYRMDRNHPWMYDHFVPHNLSGVDVPAGHPQLLGAAFAVWNDMIDLKYRGYGSVDIWNTIYDSANVMSQKFWGKEDAPRSYQDHVALVKQIGGAPGCNPLYATDKPVTCEDADAAACLKKLATPAVGPNYHVTMDVQLDQATPGREQVLLEGPTGKLFAAMKDGTVGFRRDDSVEFSFGYTLPAGQKVQLELVGKPESTQLLINGQPAGKPVVMRSHDEKAEPISTFILPTRKLGSFQGRISKLKVERSAPQK